MQRISRPLKLTKYLMNVRILLCLEEINLKVKPKPKYNYLRNKCLVFDIYTLTFLYRTYKVEVAGLSDVGRSAAELTVTAALLQKLPKYLKGKTTSVSNVSLSFDVLSNIFVSYSRFSLFKL